MIGSPAGGAPRLLRGKRAARAWAVLDVLARCAVQGSGWRWGGVGGWMLFDEVEAASAEWVPEVLPHLAQLGLATRVDVRPPGRRRPVWMYRVGEAGVSLLTAHQGRSAPALPPVGEDPADVGTFFMPRRMWAAFAVLQARARAGAGGGWLNLRQLADARARLDSEDTLWLVRAGLVERQRPQCGARPTAWRFRATEDGLRVTRTGPGSHVWVRVRMTAAPATSG